MGTPISGTINGKTIDLDRDAGLPPGSRVTVSIEKAMEKLAPTGELCHIVEGGRANAVRNDINRYNALMDPLQEAESPLGEDRIGEDSDLEPGSPTMSRAEMEKLADELFWSLEGGRGVGLDLRQD